MEHTPTIEEVLKEAINKTMRVPEDREVIEYFWKMCDTEEAAFVFQTAMKEWASIETEHLRQENAELKGVRNTLNNARNELVSKVTDLELANEGLKEHIKEQKQLVNILTSASERHLTVQRKLLQRIKELEEGISNRDSIMAEVKKLVRTLEQQVKELKD